MVTRTRLIAALYVYRFSSYIRIYFILSHISLTVFKIPTILEDFLVVLNGNPEDGQGRNVQGILKDNHACDPRMCTLFVVSRDKTGVGGGNIFLKKRVDSVYIRLRKYRHF